MDTGQDTPSLAAPTTSDASRLLHCWWPALALVGAAVAAQKVLLDGRYEVAGHAAEHLSGAGVPFMGAAVLALLFIATPPARRQPAVLASAAAWLAVTVLVMIGNVRVVDALVAEGQSRTPTSELVANPVIEDAHSLADSAPWFGVVAALALTVAMRVYGHVSTKVAVGAGFASVLFPPWLIPGAGVIVLTVARMVARGRSRP